MYASNLKCRNCNLTEGLFNYYHCRECGGILSVEYDYNRMRREQNKIKKELKNKTFNLWRYQDFLPVLDSDNIITIGEGGTPLLESPKVRKKLAVDKAYYKLENCNPTGSFKDRPTAVAVSKATELGVESVIIASSGNAGASAAAYAAKAGLKSIVCVPENTPSGKVAQAISHGANVVLVKGSYSNSYNIALQASEYFGMANLTSTFLNPYTVEGDKTLAYELWEQMDGMVPSFVIIPIGAGPLLVGVFKGFCELKEMGWIENTPRMVGVQTEACAPIADAFKLGKVEVDSWDKPIESIASGITDPLVGYPGDGTLTNSIIRKSGGLALKVSEEDIIEAAKWLATNDGIFAEPAAAASLAAAWEIDQLSFASDSTIVMVITGHGLKTSGALLPKKYKPPVIDSIAELKAIIEC